MENEYKVSIRRDTEMMKTFVKFSNRVNHPRISFHMFLIGALLISIPIVSWGDTKLGGVIICFVTGGFLVLMSLFRHNIAVHKMKKNPEVEVNEELTYCFTPKGVQLKKEGESVQNMGGYKKIYEVWEDEKHYYVGMNEEDLLVLPFDCFIEGDPQSFKEFILEKSKAPCTWKPAGLKNRAIQTVKNMKARTLAQQEAIQAQSKRQEEERAKRKAEKKAKKDAKEKKD